MKTFRVGIDSYSLAPLDLDPPGIVDWAADHGADGVQFTDAAAPDGSSPDVSSLRDLGQKMADLGMYVEWGGGQHIPFDMDTWERLDLVEINRNAAQQAQALGTRIVRSCSGGLMRWTDDAPATETLLRESAQALREQMPLLADLGVILAIEVHFEFTSFELLRMLEMSGAEPGGPIGICLDTMNLLTMLEHPVLGTERLLPWIVAVHAKDGALTPHPEGLTSFTTEIGTGLVDFDRILRRLATLDQTIHLSVEDHGGSFEIPIYDSSFLTRFPDLTTGEFVELVRLSHDGADRVKDGRLAPIEGEAWPSFCEARIARDVASLKGIVGRLAE